MNEWLSLSLECFRHSGNPQEAPEGSFGPRPKSVISLIHPVTHSFIHPLIHSFIHFFTHPLIHSLIHSFTHSLIHSFILIPSFIHSHSFIHPLIDSLIHSFTHSFSSVHLLAHSSICSRQAGVKVEAELRAGSSWPARAATFSGLL